MAEYEQGSDQRFYATFVTYKGEAATIAGTPTITITHDWSGLITDVNAQNMTLLSGTTYYYKWNIPARADQTTYNVRYNATYTNVDGTSSSIIGSEDFQVIKRKFYDKKGGGFVQKIVSPKSWSEEEKKQLFDLLAELGTNLDKTGNSNKLDVLKGLESLSDSVKKSEDFVDSSLKKLSDIDKIRVEGLELRSRIDSLQDNLGKLVENATNTTSNRTDLVFSEISQLKGEIVTLKAELDDFKQSFAELVSKTEVEVLHE